MKRLILSTILLVIAISVIAHPGRLDARGGHTNRRTGVYHYHRSQPQARPVVNTTHIYRAPIGRPVTQSARADSMKAQFDTQGVATVSEGNIGSAPEASQVTYSNIANRVASLKGRITTIYIAENNLRPQAGSVSVTLYIGADGSVKAADVVPQSGDLTTEFLQKVQQNVMSWRFSVSEMAKYRFVMQFRK